MELTTENYADFIERLKFHNIGEGVDDHITSNPIFIVQSYRQIGGIDLDYDPPHYWADSDHECEWTDKEFEAELAEYVEEGGTHDDFDIRYDKFVTLDNVILFQKIGYQEYWEYECAHFTREAAEAFIKRKAHDHRELRIYVDSQYWCWEFNAIIKGMLSGDIGLINKPADPSEYD
jgi:hypothetical protein